MVKIMEESSFAFRYIFKRNKTVRNFLDWHQKYWVPIMVEFDINETSVWVSESKTSIIFEYVVEAAEDKWTKRFETSSKREVIMNSLNAIVDTSKTENYHRSTWRLVHLDMYKAKKDRADDTDKCRMRY